MEGARKIESIDVPYLGCALRALSIRGDSCKMHIRLAIPVAWSRYDYHSSGQVGGIILKTCNVAVRVVALSPSWSLARSKLCSVTHIHFDPYHLYLGLTQTVDVGQLEKVFVASPDPFTPRTGARRWVIGHFYKYVLSRFELASTDPRYCCPSRRISVTIVRPLGGLAAVSSVRWYDTHAARMLLTGFPKGPGYLRALLATFARKLAYIRAAPADVPSYGLGAIKTSSSITSVSLEELFVNRPQLRG
jgi:hypothetical protein